MTEETTDNDTDELRTTAPQQPYTTRQVGIGVLILVIGSIITFALPLLAA